MCSSSQIREAVALRRNPGLGAWLRAAAVAMVWLLAPAGVQAAPAAEDASIGGLQAKFIDVQGVKTRYYEMGQGEPLVLIHGEGWSGHSSANVWSKNIPGLAKRFHVFAPDKIGSGMTGNPPNDRDYNIQGEVDHIVHFIQTMKLGQVHIVGQSRGGGCAFFLAVEHPGVVRTLVIVDSDTAAPEGPTTRQLILQHCPKEPDFEEWKCRLQALCFKPEVAFDEEYWEAGKYMASQPKSQQTVAKIKAGAGGDLATNSGFGAWKKLVHGRVRNGPFLMMPVLLYWGRNDPSAMLERGWDLYDVIAAQNPRLRMITVNKAGHFHFREYPEEFNYNVTSFIDYWERQEEKSPTAAGSAPNRLTSRSPAQ